MTGTKHAAINKKSNSSANPHRDTKGKGGMRSKSTIMRLSMYKSGKPVRDKSGKIIGGTLMMSDKAGGKDLPSAARIAPDRRWFGNTRVMSQTELDRFREEMSLKEADPYSVILRRKKIPMALLQESEKVARVNLLQTETFADTFGSKMTRKRPKLNESVLSYESLASKATEAITAYAAAPNPSADKEDEDALTGARDIRKEDLFTKGQSKRIWAELYKVLDCSDVVLEIVDARNVPGTRCYHVENYIKKHASHKQLVVVINKCDLVPKWVTRKWVKLLSAQFPTLAFHASITNSFGKGALISLLRQFSKLHSDKRQISVGVVGYPNCGKSSIINTLMGKPCCKAAPVPGETKVWQYITLMKRIFLIDCPGVVYDVGDDEVETVLKGVVRAERLSSPAHYVAEILKRVKREYIVRQYAVEDWTDHEDFLSKLAFAKGRLLKGGDPDMNSIARVMINDFQRGKLPYFVAPPLVEDEGSDEERDVVADDAGDFSTQYDEKNDDLNVLHVSAAGATESDEHRESDDDSSDNEDVVATAIDVKHSSSVEEEQKNTNVESSAPSSRLKPAARKTSKSIRSLRATGSARSSGSRDKGWTDI